MSASSVGTQPVRPLLRGWIHASMVPLAALGGLVLWRNANPTPSARASVAVFAVSLVGLYTVSSLYHVPRWPARVRRVLNRCDVCMIQVFIAGTFTPIAVHALEGAWRTASLTVAWSVVAAGIALAISPLSAPRWLSTLGFIAFGWLGVLPMTKLIGSLGWQGTSLIALGGLLYTLGAIVYARRWPDPWPSVFGFHEVFHVLVVAGATAHYLAIWRYVLPLAG